MGGEAKVVDRGPTWGHEDFKPAEEMMKNAGSRNLLYVQVQALAWATSALC